MEDNLEFPLNPEYILRKKKYIKREFRKQNNLIQQNIAILGGSTTSEIANILEIFLLKNGIKPIFYQSEFNKYYEDALFGNEELNNFNPDIIYIHSTNKNIVKFPEINDTHEEVNNLINDEIQKYQSIWKSLSRFECAIIQNNFDNIENRDLGNLDCYDIHGKTYFLNKLNDAFSQNAREIKYLHINDINYLSAYIGIRSWFDKALWYQAKYALSLESIPELAFSISKIINSILGKSKKCLVLDLDNTCWGGVIGDDGINGIKIGTETAISESYSSFQNYVKKLNSRGITLAVCSKNELVNAKQGFNHPETILKFDDFASFKANWDPKYLNILDIAKEINIGLDSLVFIDDNPAERELVFSQTPSVSVPNIGNNIVDFINHIDRNGFFEPLSISTDDLNRTKYYKENKKRVSDKFKFESYADFLKSLNMNSEIKSFSPIYLDRITQLINKTNQFNFTTKRYTSGEIEKVFKSKKYIKIYGKLNDKYGENGLVSIIIGSIESKQCHIDLWLMSCRVLKRDMECAMLDALVKKSKENKLTEIVGYYFKTSKNSIVSNLFETLGFIHIESTSKGSIWKLKIDNYENKNKFIEVNYE